MRRAAFGPCPRDRPPSHAERMPGKAFSPWPSRLVPAKAGMRGEPAGVGAPGVDDGLLPGGGQEAKGPAGLVRGHLGQI